MCLKSQKNCHFIPKKSRTKDRKMFFCFSISRQGRQNNLINLQSKIFFTSFYLQTNKVKKGRSKGMKIPFNLLKIEMLLMSLMWLLFCRFLNFQFLPSSFVSIFIRKQCVSWKKFFEDSKTDNFHLLLTMNIGWQYEQ